MSRCQIFLRNLMSSIFSPVRIVNKNFERQNFLVETKKKRNFSRNFRISYAVLQKSWRFSFLKSSINNLQSLLWLLGYFISVTQFRRKDFLSNLPDTMSPLRVRICGNIILGGQNCIYFECKDILDSVIVAMKPGSRGRKTKTPSPRYRRSGTREIREEARVSPVTNCHPTCMRQPVKQFSTI
jgi:hypothetical protein